MLHHFGFPYSISSRVGEPVVIPCPFNLERAGVAMPLLAFHLEASSISLLTMARDDDSDKRAWNEGPTYSGRSPLPH
jgi:hypothetical protein